jgi:predicted phage-related endonuclease
LTTIQKFPITDRKEWLHLRSADVTGSEVGALFDVHRYLTPAKLYARKSGAMPEDEVEGGPVKRGVRLESFVASQVMEMRKEDWASLSPGGSYYRDVEHRLGGTPDYLIRTKSDEVGILEIKTVGHSDFLKIWRGGDPEGEIIPEPWQLLQTLTYMYLTGASFGKIAVLPVGEWEPMDIHLVDIPRREDTIASVLARTDEFWSDVDDGIMPQFNFERDMATIKALYANVKKGSMVDLRGDNEFREMLQWHQKYANDEKVSHERKEVMAANIRARMGEYEAANADGFDVSLKQQTRKAYEVKESTFRVLRIKGHKGSSSQVPGSNAETS